MKKRWPFILIGVILTLDTLFAMLVSNINVGVVMPAVLGIPLIVFGVFRNSAFFANGIGRALKIFAAVCYVVYISIVLVFAACTFSITHAEQNDVPDVIVVLGAGVHGTEPSLTLRSRLEIAVELSNTYPDAVIVVTGGQGAQESLAEAEVMANYLVSRGVSDSRIIKEDKATSTQENFRFSLPIIIDNIGENFSCVFITNEFHAFRSLKVAEAEGYDNVYCRAIRSKWFMLPNYYMREVFAIAQYYVTGVI